MYNSVCEPELDERHLDADPLEAEPSPTRILVVDDDDNMREFCAQALSLYGYKADTASPICRHGPAFFGNQTALV